MRIDIVSCVPELLTSPFQKSIVGRAQKNGLIEIHIHDLRKYGIGERKQIDDYPYGGAAGMVLMIEPIDKCIHQLKKERRYDELIYMCPDGQLLNQPMANRLSTKETLLILCGHYKGIDERIRQYLIDTEISIGKYVLSGGELPAAVLVDAITRLLPNALGNETSAMTDSFQDELVAPPVYTRPATYKGWGTPKVLRSGHAKNIENWEFEEQVKRTYKKK